MHRTINTLTLCAMLAGQAAALALPQTGNSGWDFSQYPSVDRVPPTNAAWSKYYLSGKNIPNIPPTSGGNPHPDYSSTYTSCNNPNDWGLSYDDGPSAQTPALLDKVGQTKVTFFNIGSRVTQNPCVLKREHEAGHLNCLHTWSHPLLTTLTNDQIVAEMVYTAMLFKQIIGVAPTCFRLPWINRDTQDWNHADVVGNVRSWIANPPHGQGIISLEHDLFDVRTIAVEHCVSTV
ncbi:chitin deacetylase [Irineochytrium annulatum]|nr:chitin deacetylase [Irineochytrium annulatum]